MLFFFLDSILMSCFQHYESCQREQRMSSALPIISSTVFSFGSAPEYIITDGLVPADLTALKSPDCSSHQFAFYHIKYMSHMQRYL